MEKFKRSLKKRIKILYIFGVISIILVLITGIWGYNNSSGNDNHVASFLYGASAGAFAGLLAVILKFILKYNSIIKDENKLKLSYIEENDERERLIRDKIGTTSGYIVFSGTLIAAIILTYINITVALSLYMVILFISIIYGITKYYYKSKF